MAHRARPFLPRDRKLLTPREIQIMRLFVSDETAQRIAGMLKLEKRTVNMHRQHILEKFGVHSLHAAAYKFALIQHTFREPAFIISEGKPEL